MAAYKVHFFCDECGETHPLGIGITLDDGPADKATIGDAYKGRDLPPMIATLCSNKTQCPNTGRMTMQADNNQVFLVPVGD